MRVYWPLQGFKHNSRWHLVSVCVLQNTQEPGHTIISKGSQCHEFTLLALGGAPYKPIVCLVIKSTDVSVFNEYWGLKDQMSFF